MRRAHKYRNSRYHPATKKHKHATKDNFPRKTLTEVEVGITEFATNCEGFTGVFKARFSDFHVNEIDKDGNVIVMTNQILPKPVVDGGVKLEESLKNLQVILTPNIWKQIDNMIIGSDLASSVDIDVTNEDKDTRTLIHKTLKEIYGTKIISTTDTVNDKKFISCSKSDGRKTDGRTRWSWPFEYVYFVVHKENADTMQAASDLALALKIPPSSVNYAGTKDKRAKTTQIFCIKKKEPEQILKCSRRFPYLKIGNFDFKENVLKLGDLKGNRFRIALRHVSGDQEKMIISLENVKKNGFINYYGLQRFGNCSTVPTYQVGLSLIKGNYKEAVELILKPRDGENEFLKDARDKWWMNRDASEAAAKLYHNKSIEKKLLEGLVKFGGNDYANSLRRIPRNMLLLYTHSFQSLIWNKIVSRRISKYHFQIIPGDLVFKDKNAELNTQPTEYIDDDMNSKTNDLDNESAEETKSVFKLLVHPLSENDISSGTYTIYDIVLPLPGHDITYPDNEMKLWYEEILAEYDLNSEKLKNNVKVYSLAGAYRKLFIKPENMSWKFKRYDSPTSTLIASDFETMNDRRADTDKADGSLLALLLDFRLPSAAYATMALREILKADTSAMSQTRIENEEMKKVEEKQNEKPNETSSNVSTETEKKRTNEEETDNNDAKRVKTD